jgi:hypothetical protein
LGFSYPSRKLASAGARKDKSMSEFETEVVEFETSDEALEIAAGQENANYTLGACTGLSVCPA